jgi:dienelactone hydrolase
MLVENVLLSLDEVGLNAELHIPADAKCIAMFVNASGSSRFNPRNQLLAKEFNRAGIATLLFDLLTPEEESGEETSNLRFDVSFLTKRTLEASRYLRENEDTERLSLCYFASGTGAAAALAAASRKPNDVKAIVIKGGRFTLLDEPLDLVRAPTLFITGERDSEMVAINRKVASRMRCESHVELVVGASSLFDEEGAFDRVAQLASEWFLWHATR